MSKTLFWYIFRDLLRIYLLAQGVLTGILSFGGLIRPMLESGLSGVQVLHMLAYFMPAAQTYALPVAALFATTMVYGRLSADNEITACRAAGISYWTLSAPAAVIGLLLALVTLVSLCFVVPYYTLQAERVVYSSLADVVVKSIQREHRLKLPGVIVYAESAERVPLSLGQEGEAVRLYSPMFCIYRAGEWADEISGKTVRIQVPSEFYTASQATATIRQRTVGVEFSARLEGGASFRRDATGGNVGGVAVAHLGPIPLPSPIRDNTKFMNIGQLQDYYQDPTRHRSIREEYANVTREEQVAEFFRQVTNRFRQARRVTFDCGDGESYAIEFERAVRNPVQAVNQLLWISPTETRDIRLLHYRDGELAETDEARNLALRAQVDSSETRIRLAFDLDRSPQRVVSVAMTPELRSIADRGPAYYQQERSSHSPGAGGLRQKLPAIRSAIHAEIHARASFAVSCFILVMMGAALGMMFRTGNFLTAFALSVIPAFMCIAIMVTGQHVAEADARNLRLGLALVWGGNALVGVLAAVLLGYLRRQ
jgi:lipopolysaccharide export LptBFGC system permease protein LptF